jgi:hypothetical protein
MSAAHSSLVADCPSLVEQDQSAALRHGGQDRRAFLGAPLARPLGPGFVELANIDAGQSRAPRALRQSLEVTFEQQTLRPRLQLPDANQREAHALSSCSFLPAGPRSTSFQGYRTDGHPDGRCARWRPAHRAGPSRKAAFPRLLARESRPRDRPLTTRSAMAPTCTLERPEAMIIRSASVVLPSSSSETISSAFASSSPSTMICDKDVGRQRIAGTGGGAAGLGRRSKGGA